MKRLKIIIASLMLLVSASVVFAPTYTANAADALKDVCKNNSESAVCESRNDYSADSIVKTVVNTLLFLTGGVAVLAIIVGGIQFATSQGNSATVAKAKNTILYAVIGLVVAFLAYAIVNFVLKII